MDITRDDVYKYFLHEAGVQKSEYDAKLTMPLKDRVASRIAISDLEYDHTYNKTTDEGILRKLKVTTNISDFKVGEYMLLHEGNPSYPIVKCQLYDILDNGDLLIQIHNYEPKDRLLGLKPYTTGLILDKQLPDMSSLYALGARCIKDETLCLFNEVHQPSMSDLNEAKKNLQEVINEFGFKLTDKQREAAENAIAAEDYYLIQGPPGTGKSFVISVIILTLHLKYEKNIVVSGPTHLAINNVLSKVVSSSQGKVRDKVFKVGQSHNKTGLEAIVGGAPVKIHNHNVAPATKINSNQQYICGLTPYHMHTKRGEQVEPDVVIIDEAGQMTTGLAMLAMTRCSKVIFVGDHKQLSPIVKFAKHPDMLSKSVFEHLWNGTNGVMLDRSFRMNGPICDLVSSRYYGGKLISDDPSMRLSIPLITTDPVLDKDMPVVLKHIDDNGTCVSEKEAEYCAELVDDLICKYHISPGQIGVISPFRAQGALIRTKLRDRKIPDYDKVVVDTVERMQGQEREFIIISLTVGRLDYMSEVVDFIENPNRLNVAFSRAKNKLVILCNAHMFNKLASDLGSCTIMTTGRYTYRILPLPSALPATPAPAPAPASTPAVSTLHPAVPIASHMDPAQRRVITAAADYNLVLAPPGCGKTEILTHRIIYARGLGFQFGEMMCLTFTNRASRGMMERIKTNIKDPDIVDLMVGNLHHFCSKFLFANLLLPLDTSIIDELDVEDILDECGIKKNPQPMNYGALLQNVMAAAHRQYQVEHNHPKDVYLYQHVLGVDGQALECVNDIAIKYNEYKNENHLLDFDDLLLYTYTALMSPTYKADYLMADYKWIQVDEVQDLSPIQLAIVDKITATSGQNVMYLGDEQQAIFSFMGAKLDSLERLRKRAHGIVLRLEKNYRSPKYLLDIFNRFANLELNIDMSLLPTTTNLTAAKHSDLRVIRTGDSEDEPKTIVSEVIDALNQNPSERVAVLVRYNSQADAVSEELDNAGISHFKISGTDVFKTEVYKALVAHMTVVVKDNSYMEWARLLWATRSTHSFKDARMLVKSLRDAGMTPGDFLNNPGSSYLKDFYEAYRDKEFVVFDTETTGLNVFEDDIIQIAAFKVKNGNIVPGSDFNMILETKRPIPLMLGKNPNPMVAVYNSSVKSDRRQALEMFLDYVGDCEVLGHNVNYDINILKHNVLRDCGGVLLPDNILGGWDSLKLIRLLRPYLRVYRLESLLQVLGLTGVNSHKADDDILATKSLVDYCYQNIPEMVQKQNQVMASVQNRNVANTFKNRYENLYRHTIGRLHESLATSTGSIMGDEMEWVYKSIIIANWLEDHPRMDYVLKFLSSHICTMGKGEHLLTQLQNHLVELTSFTEADLCDSTILTDKVYVMTVYKAKGLEFETVIVYNAVDGTYPHFSKVSEEEKQEDKRLFYVAMSRAKKRLLISYCNRFRYYRKELTPFMATIQDFFEQ